MNNSDIRELKLFVKFSAVLLTSLYILCRLTTATYADDVLVADAPGNIGGNNGINSESTILDSFRIDISSDRNIENHDGTAPDIIYAPDSTGGRSSVPAPVDIHDAVDITNENNEPTEESIRILRPGDQSNEYGAESETISIDDIYVPDSDDDCPVSSAVPLPIELQEYLWTKCKKATGDYKNYYAFCLGVMEHESSFRAKATHHNSNGSTDRGIMQINSSNIGKMKRAGFISCAEDLYNAYKWIDCGVHMLNNYSSQFGVSESAYYAYNTGRERKGSNKNSRIVMGYMSKWNTVLFG